MFMLLWLPCQNRCKYSSGRCSSLRGILLLSLKWLGLTRLPDAPCGATNEVHHAAMKTVHEHRSMLDCTWDFHTSPGVASLGVQQNLAGSDSLVAHSELVLRQNYGEGQQCTNRLPCTTARTGHILLLFDAAWEIAMHTQALTGVQVDRDRAGHRQCSCRPKNSTYLPTIWHPVPV